MGILVLAPGAWAANNCKTLHVFDGTGQSNPAAGLIFDTTGNLCGTTVIGGAHRGGTVFKLTPNTDGSWTESVLHRFAGRDGAAPEAGLIFDQAGNLYGTALD